MGRSSAAKWEITALSRDVGAGPFSKLTKSAALAVGGFKKAAKRVV